MSILTAAVIGIAAAVAYLVAAGIIRARLARREGE